MISFLGDLAFNGLISEDPSNNSERFSSVAKLLGKSDYVIANLEFPVKADEEFNELKELIHYSLQQPVKELLEMLNIKCVSLANNHVYDCKMSGLVKTIDILDDLGIYHTGAGWNKEHIEPVIFTYKGASIGFLAYADQRTNPHTEHFPEVLINYLSPAKVEMDIKALKAQVDKVICSIHWGKDYSNFYTTEQKKLACQFVDFGADLVVGHHPHTIQPYELYRDKPIFFSLGQLCFGDFLWEGKQRALRRKTKQGMVVRFSDPNFDAFDLIPTIEHLGNRISITRKNLSKFLVRLRYLNRLKNRFSMVSFLVRIKEAYVDRIYEYFFGYYRSPFMDWNRSGFRKKIRYMSRDFNSSQH